MSGLLAHLGLLMAADVSINPTYAWATTLGGVGASFADSNAMHSVTSGVDSGSNYGVRTAVALAGKVYCEFALVSQASNNNYHGFGLVNSSSGGSIYDSNAWCLISRSPTGSSGCGLILNGYNTDGAWTTNAAYAHQAADRIGVAFDAATGKIWYRKNGAWISGDPAAGTGETHSVPAGTYYFAACNYSCNAAGANPVNRIYPTVGSQLGGLPSGFAAYQP